MFPPLTLADSRHEAFAIALAEGAPTTAAYRHAGFPAKNAKARGAALAKDPDIVHRVDYLRCCLPRVCDLQARFAPSTLLMPETREQMLACLWQIGNGTRTITPVQMRAIALFSRIQGWHLAVNRPKPTTSSSTGRPDSPKTAGQPSDPPPPSSPPGDHERATLAAIATEIATADSTLQPLDPQRAAQLKSAIADAFLRDIAHLIDPEASAETAEVPGTQASGDSTEPWITTILTQLAARGICPKDPRATATSSTPDAPAEAPPIHLPTSAELCALPRVDRSKLPIAERFNLKFPHLGIDLTAPYPYGLEDDGMSVGQVSPSDHSPATPAAGS